MSDSLVAIVTGGAQGLGAAICRALLNKGYKVCVADILEEKGNEFVKEQSSIHGAGKVIFSYCDVTQEENYHATFKQTLDSFQRVDLLVNNAGISLEQNPKKVIEVNLIGPMFGCRTAFKFMGKTNGGKGGVVINTASVYGLLPGDSVPAYVASKHGVVGLTRSFGLPYHMERDGITFAAVCPSYTDTDILKKNNSLRNNFSELMATLQLMSPDYVAEGYLKILEEKINGSVLMVTRYGFEYIKIQEELKNFRI